LRKKEEEEEWENPKRDRER